MRFGSVCSGIEAASVAWEPLGWVAAWLAEIEDFPSAVLAHHYPSVPNLGDMTTIERRVLAGEVEAPDLLVGGTPCQAYSLAGLRGSLEDPRAQLTLSFVRIANAIDVVRSAAGKEAAWVLWENVPGVFSTKDNAFGHLLAGLCGLDQPIVPRGGWKDAGVVAGPERWAAWRVLDAQYHSLAQRRERVFVLSRGGPAPWACADALLPLVESVRWNPAPSRATRKDAAAGAAGRAAGGGDVSPAVTSKWAKGTGGPAGDECQNLVASSVAPPVTSNPYGDHESREGLLVAHTLTASGFDASEDGSSGAFIPVAFDPTQITSPTNRSNPRPGDPCHTLAKGQQAPTVAFLHCNKGRPDGRKSRHEPMVTVETETIPTLCTDGHAQSAVAIPLSSDCANGRGGEALTPSADAEGRVRLRPPSLGIGKPGDPSFTLQASGAPAIAFSIVPESGQGADLRASEVDVAPAITTEEAKSIDRGTRIVAAMAVRRLTVKECSRLQGFPDDYLLQVPWKGKAPPPDGPMYKALGNSMAVTVMRYIGRQIDRVVKENA